MKVKLDIKFISENKLLAICCNFQNILHCNNMAILDIWHWKVSFLSSDHPHYICICFRKNMSEGVLYFNRQMFLCVKCPSRFRPRCHREMYYYKNSFCIIKVNWWASCELISFLDVLVVFLIDLILSINTSHMRILMGNGSYALLFSVSFVVVFNILFLCSLEK